MKGKFEEVSLFVIFCSVFVKNTKKLFSLAIAIPFPARDLKVPKCQLMPSQKLTESLKEFFSREGAKSINDFGAGVGQYGISLRREDSIYRGYDEAGDVGIYTQGFINYFDLSIPLKLPVADWVISFEHGHLVPPEKEGMLVRNLHAHNCKGMIISWGTYGEVELESHNLHDEQYIIETFNELGYFYDVVQTDYFRQNWDPETDGMWLHNTLLVLRRLEPIC